MIFRPHNNSKNHPCLATYPEPIMKPFTSSRSTSSHTSRRTHIAAALCLLWAVGVCIHYARSLAQANEAYDRTLLGSALAIAEQVAGLLQRD